MQSLASEMVFSILDHLTTDFKSMADCTLVCRSWSKFCQRHFFHTISLTGHQRCQRLLRLLDDSPHIINFIRQLSILSFQHCWHENGAVVTRILQQLDNLQQLEISFYPCGTPQHPLKLRLEEPHRSLIATTLGLPSMTSFNLIYCELPSGVINIHYLLLHATALKSLTISCEDTSQGSVDFSTLEQANQCACLEELMLDVSSLQYFMEWALHPRNCVLDLRGLRKLAITNINDPTPISKLLVTFGATLEHVRLSANHWGDTEAYLDFSLCRQLCSLDINLAFAGYFPQYSLPPWLANCLQTIPPTTSLCRVTIRMALLADEEDRTSHPPYLDALRSACRRLNSSLIQVKARSQSIARVNISVTYVCKDPAPIRVVFNQELTGDHVEVKDRECWVEM